MATVVETFDRGSDSEQSALVAGAAQTLIGRKTRTFRVADTTNDSTAIIEAGIPQPNDAHPDDSWLLVRRVSAKALDAPDIFEVRVEYERQGLASGSTNPLLEPPNISWSSQLVEEATMFDINDRQIFNTAGEAFDQPITRSYPLVTLNYQSNVAAFTANIIFTHVGRINHAVWNTTTIGSVPAQCAMLRGVSAQIVWSADVMYFSRSYEFVFRSQLDKNNAEKGWKLRLLNLGYTYKDANDSNKPKQILENGLPVRVPKILKVDGTGPEPNQQTATPHIIEFDIYRTADFSALGVI